MKPVSVYHLKKEYLMLPDGKDWFRTHCHINDNFTRVNEDIAIPLNPIIDVKDWKVRKWVEEGEETLISIDEDAYKLLKLDKSFVDAKISLKDSEIKRLVSDLEVYKGWKEYVLGMSFFERLKFLFTGRV